jgi:hypothetical protein
LRTLDVRNRSNKNPTLTTAATTAIEQPINNPFQAIGCQYSTQLSAKGSIGDNSELIWFCSAIPEGIALRVSRLVNQSSWDSGVNQLPSASHQS